MIEQLTYALVVVFALEGGQVVTVDTVFGFDQPAACISVAQRENAQVRDRVYICRERYVATSRALPENG